MKPLRSIVLAVAAAVGLGTMAWAQGNQPTQGSDAVSQPNATPGVSAQTNSSGNPGNPSRQTVTGPTTPSGTASLNTNIAPEPVFNNNGINPTSVPNPNGLNTIGSNVFPNQPNSANTINGPFNNGLAATPASGFNSPLIAPNGAINPNPTNVTTPPGFLTPETAVAPGETSPGLRQGAGGLGNSLNTGLSGTAAPLGTHGNNGQVGNPGAMATPGAPAATSPTGSGH